MGPHTLQEAIIYFADSDNCREYLVAHRWPNGVTCPRCGSTKVLFQPKYNRWQCGAKHPLRQFTAKTGTIFEDSPLSLDKWLMAMWLVVNCKNGVSSYAVHRDIGVTQKTAWFMDHRIRLALGMATSDRLSGKAEADETFVGGKACNMHISNRHRRIIGKYIEAGAALYTHARLSYHGLASEFAHEVGDHAVAYVDWRIHTNGPENFRSLLNRSINGRHISFEPFELSRCLDEQARRYNNRKMVEGEAVGLRGGIDIGCKQRVCFIANAT